MNRKSDLVNFFRAAGFLFLLLVSEAGYGQQDPQFTQYLYAGNFFNPALVGKSDGLQFSVFHRSQWQGYLAPSGSGNPPTTQLITFQNRLKNKNVGYGLTVVNDQLGAISNLEINLQGSYHKKIQRTQLSFGGYLGVSNSTLDFEELQFVNPEPNLPLTGTESQMALDMGAGLVIDRENLYVGLSGRHLNQATYDFGDGNYANRLQVHNYLLLGYRMRPIGQVRIEPSVQLKSLGVHTFSYEVSVIATIQNKVNGGIAFRGEESVSLILGYSLLKDNSLKLGYAFDLVIGGEDAKSPTSHELMLRYAWQDVSKTVNRVIQRTPRFRF
jgi:type IX secretion system PorP/SprF family membrane protein